MNKMQATWTACLAGALVVSAAGAERVVEEKSGYELWGMRPRHVAVVNPVLGEDPRWTMSLGGEWEFCAHKNMAERNASWGSMFAHEEKWKDVRKIRVPGFVELQGVGEPGTSSPWDCTWDCSPKPLKHVFEGSGWYRRTFKIPAEWTGRRIWLKIGDVTSQGWFWVNGTQVAWAENYCGTYKYEITDLVKPGAEAKFVIQISNAVAKRGGTRNHENKWLGIPRELALEATPSKAFVDDAWCRGDFDARVAEVHVEIAGNREQGTVNRLRATIEGETTEAPVAGDGETVLRVPLKKFRPWSPESPNLYTAKVELVENGVVTQTRRERFGVRKFEVRGKDFYLNGKPFFMRGIGYHNVQPVYGPGRMADRDYRRFEVKRMRDAGFNFMRTHTRCETPEFFDACDELGMMVQPELPYYTDVPCEKFEFNPIRDAKELFVHMRRHPSFAVYSHGNEGTFGPELGRHMYKLLKAMDPDRLVIEQDGCTTSWWSDGKFATPDRADFAGGPVEEWPRGSVTSDRPLVAHEYLNLSVKANAELEDSYSGIWQTPFTRRMRAEFLAKFGLTDFWGKRLQLAQHALQAYWLKHGIESARQDPECDGYYYWSAQDCTTPVEKNGVQTYTAQGLFDPFWGDKPNGPTAQSVAVYNSPRGLFCDTLPESRIFVAGETVSNAVSFANYGDAPVAGAKLAWRLVAKRGGAVLAQGEKAVADQPVGAIRPLADVVFAAPETAHALAATFEVSFGDARNAWDVWIFPRRGVRSAPGVCIVAPLAAKLAPRYADLVPEERVAEAKVVVAPADSDAAKAALARGQHVVAIGPADGKPDVKLGWWWLGDQVGTAIADDPALKFLPHSGALDPLFFRIFKKGAALPLAGVSERDMQIVCEGGFACSCNLAVRRHGKAREHLVFGLDVCADLPEAKALLDGILDAAQAADFRVDAFGARQDATAAENRAAFAKAVDAAHAAGGGRVVVPAGDWKCGTIWLKDGVELHVAKGATIFGSLDQKDYNANDCVPENWHSEGEEWSGGHLVFAYRAKDVAVTGEGTIDGNGPAFFGECDENGRFPWYKYGLKLKPLDRTWFRPGFMLCFLQCRNVRMSGVTLKNTPCWTAHFRCCDGVTVENVVVDADRTIANSDGVSFDCTRNAVIRNSVLKTGDDSVTIRASCHAHAATNVCEKILVENCDIWGCCFGVRVGVGTGDIRDVTIRNCRVHESAEGIGVTTAFARKARNVHVSGLRIENCSVRESSCGFSFRAAGNDLLKDVVVRNCDVEALCPNAVHGVADGFVEDVTFENCSFRMIPRLKVRHDLSWWGSRPSERDSSFVLTNAFCRGVRLVNCRPAPAGESGVLLLSFDDRNFAGWEGAMSLFAKYGAHASFCVSGPIDNVAVRSLKKLSEAGHSIMLHGLTHANADEAIARDGAEKYFMDDVVPQKDAIYWAYVPCSTFAYPNCRFNEASDKLLVEKGFVRLRGGVKGATPYDPQGVKQKDRKPLVTNESVFFPAAELPKRRRIDTIIMGEAYHTDVDEILACIRRAAKNREVLSITSHDIAPDAKGIHMKTEWLEKILACAKECGIAVLGFDELPPAAK